MSPAVVVVILNGAIVASAPPAQLLFGHVMAPLAPIVTHFTQRAVLDGDTITLVRGDRTCVLHIGSDAIACNGITSGLPVAPFGRDGVAYVPLEEVARALGGAAEYDPHTRIAALDVAPRERSAHTRTVRSECAAIDADDDLHPDAGAGDPTAGRFGQPGAAAHGDPRRSVANARGYSPASVRPLIHSCVFGSSHQLAIRASASCMPLRRST